MQVTCLYQLNNIFLKSAMWKVIVSTCWFLLLLTSYNHPTRLAYFIAQRFSVDNAFYSNVLFYLSCPTQRSHEHGDKGQRGILSAVQRHLFIMQLRMMNYDEYTKVIKDLKYPLYNFTVKGVIFKPMYRDPGNYLHVSALSIFNKQTYF